MGRRSARAVETPAPRPLDFAFILTAASLWGAAAVVGTLLGQESGIPAATVAFLRLFVGGVGFTVTLALAGKFRGQRLGRAADIRILLTAIGLAVFEGCFFAAFRELSVSLAIFIILGTTPIAVATWHALVNRRLPSLRVTAAMAVALGGMAALMLGSHTITVTPLGIILSVTAGLGFAMQIIVNEKPLPGLSPYVLTALAYTLAGMMLAPFAILQGLTFPRTVKGIALLAVLVAFLTILAYVLYLLGLRTVPGTEVAVLTLIEPVVAMVGGILVLHETVTVSGFLGGALIALAVVLLRPPRPKPLKTVSGTSGEGEERASDEVPVASGRAPASDQPPLDPADAAPSDEAPVATGDIPDASRTEGDSDAQFKPDFIVPQTPESADSAPSAPSADLDLHVPLSPDFIVPQDTDTDENRTSNTD